MKRFFYLILRGGLFFAKKSILVLQLSHTVCLYLTFVQITRKLLSDSG